MEERNNSYEEFLVQNAHQINKFLGLVILASVIVGPVCALIRLTGIFDAMSYQACFIAAGLSLVAAGIHYALVKSKHDSRNTAMIILFLLEVIIVYMRASGFNVTLALFIVPMLSLLYCERKMYLTGCVIGFAGMAVGLFLSKEHWGEILNTEDANSWLLAYGLSYVIEYAMMFVAGLMINFVISWHMGITYSDRLVIRKKDEEVYKDKLTGMWNKLYVYKAFTKHAIQGNKKCCLMIFSVEGLGQLKQTLGTGEADRAVGTYAKVLRETFKTSKSAILCHTDPDEFTVLIPEMSSDMNMNVILEMVTRDADYAFNTDAKYRELKSFAGAATMANVNVSYDELRFLAENALMNAKNSSEKSFHVYEEGEVSDATLARVRRKQTKIS